MKRLMYHRGKLVRSGLIVLVAFILLAAGLVPLSPQKVAADDLPLFEGSLYDIAGADVFPVTLRKAIEGEAFLEVSG